MGKLTYVGRQPDGDAVVVPKLYAVNAQAAAAATVTSVNAQIAATAALLTSRSYVDAQDLGRAHKAEVDAADLLYVPGSQLNQASGIAGLDSSGNLISSQIPTNVRTDRIAQCFSVRQGKVGFDAVGTSIATGGTDNLTASGTITIGDKANCAVVSASIMSSVARSIVVTIGTQTMSLLGKQTVYPAALPQVSEVLQWGLIDPPTGPQTWTIAITGGTDEVSAGISSYTNVGGFGTPVTGSSIVSGSTATLTTLAATDQMVAAAFAVANPSSTAAFGTLTPTQRFNIPSIKNACWGLVIGDAPGAPSVTFSSVSPAGNGWGGIATPLLPITSAGSTGTITLTAPYTAVATALPGQQMATIDIPDLGFPYRALPFAWVKGDSSLSSPPTSRTVGTGSWGLVTAQDPLTSQIYGLGLLTDSYYSDMYAMLPHGAVAQTPTTVPAISGALTLNLYATLWSGTTYTFYPDDLVYYVICFPAL